MSAQVFEAVSLMARYWFVLLIAYILLRIVQNSLDEYKIDRRMRLEGERSYVAYLKVVDADDAELLGLVYGLNEFNTIGKSIECDITIPDKSMRKKHAKIYKKGPDWILEHRGSSIVFVNGEESTGVTLLNDNDNVAFSGTMAKFIIRRQRNEHTKKA